MPLNDEQLQQVKTVVALPGWYAVMKPALENRARNAIKALTLTRTEREKVMASQEFNAEDEVLRAIIRQCEWMISVWDNEIKVAEHNRQVDELGRQDAVGAVGANPLR